jgi:hypothetical protein
LVAIEIKSENAVLEMEWDLSMQTDKYETERKAYWVSCIPNTADSFGKLARSFVQIAKRWFTADAAEITLAMITSR